MVVKLDHKIADLFSSILVTSVLSEISIESLSVYRHKANLMLRAEPGAPALESLNNYGPIFTFKCSVQTIFNWVFSSDKRFYSLDFGPESLPRTSIKKGRENLGVWVLICYGQPS